MIEDESVLTRAAPGPDETVHYGPVPEQVIDVWPGTGPLVAFVHGGFWRPAYDRVHTYPLANALRAAGWSVASIEFRRHPGRPGHTTADVAAALEALVPLAPQGFVLSGHSAGGHLALWAASVTPPPNLRGVLALAPVSDLTLADDLGLGRGAVRAFLGAGPGEYAALDPVRLPSPAVPTVVVQGALDATVPLAVARAYHARHPGTDLIVLPDSGHYGLIDPLSTDWPTVLSTLSSVLR